MRREFRDRSSTDILKWHDFILNRHEHKRDREKTFRETCLGIWRYNHGVSKKHGESSENTYAGRVGHTMMPRENGNGYLWDHYSFLRASMDQKSDHWRRCSGDLMSTMSHEHGRRRKAREMWKELQEILLREQREWVSTGRPGLEMEKMLFCSE